MIGIGCGVAPLCSGSAHDFDLHMFPVFGRNMAWRLITDGRECYMIENAKLLPRAFACVGVEVPRFGIERLTDPFSHFWHHRVGGAGMCLM